MPLVGIARLASESDLLESKRHVNYFDLENRSLITRVSSTRVPFEWSINPYRGCEFGCRYCYARYTHEFMELREWRQFEQQIYAKQFDADRFAKELARVPRTKAIGIGTATDPYQPAERRYQITRQILEVLTRSRGRTFSITTKSDLVARDADLLQEIGARNSVAVMMTVTTSDEQLARVLEPFAPRPMLRFEAIRKLSDAGIRCAVLACPVMPLINDSRRSLESVAAAAKDAGALYMYGNVLFLKACARPPFFDMLENRFPHLVKRYRDRYESNAFLKGLYPEMIRERMISVRERFGLTDRPGSYQPPNEPEAGEQLSLWV